MAHAPGSTGRAEPYPAERAPVALSELVTERLTETGWTLTTVAGRAGLSIATVSAIKKGRRGKRPRPSTVAKLARGLALPEDTLLRALRPDPRGARRADGTVDG